MSSKRLDRISDYAREGYRLRVDCRDCGHTAFLDARELTSLCVKRGWHKDMFSVGKRLRCSNCGSRNVLSGPSFGHQL